MWPGRRSTCIAVGILTALLQVAWPRAALGDEHDISVGGVWVCRITHNASGYAASQRAVEVRRRITAILSNPAIRTGAEVSVRSMGKDAVVTVGGMLVFTVTPQDALGISVTPLALARQWAQRLTTGLSQALPDTRFHTF